MCTAQELEIEKVEAEIDSVDKIFSLVRLQNELLQSTYRTLESAAAQAVEANGLASTFTNTITRACKTFTFLEDPGAAELVAEKRIEEEAEPETVSPEPIEIEPVEEDVNRPLQPVRGVNNQNRQRNQSGKQVGTGTLRRPLTKPPIREVNGAYPMRIPRSIARKMALKGNAGGTDQATESSVRPRNQPSQPNSRNSRNQPRQQPRNPQTNVPRNAQRNAQRNAPPNVPPNRPQNASQNAPPNGSLNRPRNAPRNVLQHAPVNADHTDHDIKPVGTYSPRRLSGNVRGTSKDLYSVREIMRRGKAGEESPGAETRRKRISKPSVREIQQMQATLRPRVTRKPSRPASSNKYTPIPASRPGGRAGAPIQRTPFRPNPNARLAKSSSTPVQPNALSTPSASSASNGLNGLNGQPNMPSRLSQVSNNQNMNYCPPRPNPNAIQAKRSKPNPRPFKRAEDVNEPDQLQRRPAIPSSPLGHPDISIDLRQNLRPGGRIQQGMDIQQRRESLRRQSELLR